MSTARVHPTAVVDRAASLGDGVVIGPLCVVGADVVLGDGTELVAQATVLGPARLGRDNRVLPFAVLGAPPQDRSHDGEATLLEVGDANVFREHVTVHRGTTKGGGLTRIGSRCLLMVGSHVAHDAALGDGVTLTNNVSLGGHVVVEDGVICGGHVAVAPFVHLGTLAFLAGGAMVERDVPPYLIAAGDRARVRALNRVGLERAGVPADSIAALKRAFAALYRSGQPLRSAAGALFETERDPHATRLLRFVLERSDDPRLRHRR